MRPSPLGGVGLAKRPHFRLGRQLPPEQLQGGDEDVAGQFFPGGRDGILQVRDDLVRPVLGRLQPEVPVVGGEDVLDLGVGSLRLDRGLFHGRVRHSDDLPQFQIENRQPTTGQPRPLKQLIRCQLSVVSFILSPTGA